MEPVLPSPAPKLKTQWCHSTATATLFYFERQLTIQPTALLAKGYLPIVVGKSHGRSLAALLSVTTGLLFASFICTYKIYVILLLLLGTQLQQQLIHKHRYSGIKKPPFAFFTRVPDGLDTSSNVTLQGAGSTIVLKVTQAH